MLLLLYALNQLLLAQERGVSNYLDRELAINYAQLALLDAEVQVYQLDLEYGLEHPSNYRCNTSALYSLAYNRYKLVSCPDIDKNLVAYGKSCNKGNLRSGWCYAPVFDDSYRENPSFRPWLEETQLNIIAPCPSYITRKRNGVMHIPWIDIFDSPYAHIYATGDISLCANPRYMLEIIDLDYHLAKFNSARLYRITVRAFGKNGNTRVTVQEYLAIAMAESASLSILPLSIRWLL